jgi:hypothetical protein
VILYIFGLQPLLKQILNCFLKESPKKQGLQFLFVITVLPILLPFNTKSFLRCKPLMQHGKIRGKILKIKNLKKKSMSMTLLLPPINNK